MNNHPVLMWNGEWENSDNLSIGDSVCSMTKIYHSKFTKSLIDYFTNFSKQFNSFYDNNQDIIKRIKQSNVSELLWFLGILYENSNSNYFKKLDKFSNELNDEYNKIQFGIYKRNEVYHQIIKILNFFNMNYQVCQTENEYQFEVDCLILKHFIHHLRRNNSFEKESILIELKKQEKISFICGIIDSKGKIKNKTKSISIQTQKSKIASQLRNILYSLGIYSLIQKKSRQNTQKIEIKSGFKKLENNSIYVEKNINQIGKWKDISLKGDCTKTVVIGIEEVGLVNLYNFSVENIETYICDNIVTHNCGRAGRPQFDTSGKAVIMVQDKKKDFYRKFLFDPFPVESSLIKYLHDHINAEIVSGTITNKQDMMDFFTWTYLFRRLSINPSYYQIEDASTEGINKFLSKLIEETTADLEETGCIEANEMTQELIPTTSGEIASFYYLNYKSIDNFQKNLKQDCGIEELIRIISNCSEFSELPVRHNENELNQELATKIRFQMRGGFDKPSVKTNILLQTHFSRGKLPISDYITDTKLVLDQIVRVAQAMIDVISDRGWLLASLLSFNILQMVSQALWFDDSTLYTLPYIDQKMVDLFSQNKIYTLPQLLSIDPKIVYNILKQGNSNLEKEEISEILEVIRNLPSVKLDVDSTFKLENGFNIQEDEIVIELQLKYLKPYHQAFAPRFPKQRDITWSLILGDLKKDLLFSLKRVLFKSKANPKLRFILDQDEIDILEKGQKIEWDLFLLCDKYLGLDQQYKIVLMKKESIIYAKLKV
eukprot:Anaeramoba_ignava/c21685_g2_i1.p2 GENE.c21685_g2_i1~~c21685_g2_i1.p2  ORF type:complete len:772 (-),score=270.97 c21685_g2_i1:36-2351(-)